jgi:pilus assembly protein FimV
VVSRKPVREPYLNFVVEVARPGGRVLREYTLLIDPPEALADRPQAAGFQLASEAAAPRMRLPEVATPPVALQGNTYTVVRGDSLWKIARGLQAAGSQVAMPMLMADIHALNPQAFVGGDIDRLISGATLLLPDRANPAVPAVTEAAMNPGQTVEMVAPATAPVLPADAVQATVQSAEVETAAVTQAIEVQRKLDEVLATQERERLQLQQQMNDLQSQLTSLRLEVASKNEQVETLRSQLDQQVPLSAVEQQPEPTMAVAPAVTPTINSDTAGVSGWLLSLTGGVLLAAIAGGIFWWRRREPVEPEPERVLADYPKASPLVAAAPVRVRVAPSASVVAEAGAAVPVPPAEPDALDGANIYIAYGRLDEAREVLERAAEKEPARNDIRLRLLELLARMGDSAAFALHEQQLLANAGDPAQLQRIKSAHPDLSDRPADVLENAVLNLSEPDLPKASNDLLGDAPLNLDDLSLDADWGLVSPFDQVIPSKAASAKEEVVINGRLELPEVKDISSDAEALSPFSNFQINSKPADELAGGNLVDPFGEDHRHTGRNLDHLAAHPQSLSRLNMALAYIDQGDLQSACDILNQLISEGDDRQKKQAREILARIA